MQKQIVLLLIFLLLLISPLMSDIKVKVKGKVETKRTRKLKQDEINIAIQDGKIRAIKKYAENLGSAKLKLLNEIMPDLIADIDSYILDINILSEGENIGGTWAMNLEVTISDNQIDQLLTSLHQENIDEELYMSFVYVAREVNSIETYSSTGTKKNEDISYQAYNSVEINTRVTEEFNNAGFEVVPAFEVNILPEQFADDFASNGEISSSTQKEATDIARDAGLDFLALAMLDIGRDEIDSVTGQYKIYVKVNGYVLDLRKRFATKICSVGPVQYSGYGENPTVAKTNAMIIASSTASNDLIDQLRVKLNN